MTDDRAADDLRHEFEALRARVEGSGAAPDFDAMWARARVERERAEAPASRRVPWSRWIPLAAAAALAGILVLPRGNGDPDAEFERLVSEYSEMMAGGGWRSPTASLLDVPGIDLGAVPSFRASSEGRTP